MTEKDGWPAFPRRGVHPIDGYDLLGMSIRDYFAGQALVGRRAGAGYGAHISTAMAQLCYEDAEAMIQARETRSCLDGGECEACDRERAREQSFHLTDEEREKLVSLYQWLRENEYYESASPIIRRILDAPTRNCGGCRWWEHYDEDVGKCNNMDDSKLASWDCADWEGK